jgi:hypothetical protein
MRLVKWGIVLATTFFVLMMFAPLVRELVTRVRIPGGADFP